MPPRGGGDDELWVPITINLPLGALKGMSFDSCASLSLLVGPFMIIMLAQTANTVLVPVLPFLVKDVGASAVAYGLLQSTLWTSQTVLAPVLGWLSDRIGRRRVIIVSLLVSAAGNLVLAFSHSVAVMAVARVVSGLGFQIALFRAYFADTTKAKEKAGKFGLIGVLQSFSLFAGPTIGGAVAKAFGQRAACILSASLFVIAAAIGVAWREEMPPKPPTAEDSTHKTVGGVSMVKIDLSKTRPCGPDGEENSARCGLCSENSRLTKAWKFAVWLNGYDLYPLLSLNFFFRFAFAAYKSVFAFFCMAMLSYGADQVGYLLSAMGLGGMFVQGVLVRITVGSLGEEKTLLLAMACTSGGFVLLSVAKSLELLVPALSLIAIGYGLAVPCLTTLFSNVPVEQGIMQGIAGAIDRFGQAFGPIVGGSLLHFLGEAALMRWTGFALAGISAICLLFIGDGCASWIRDMCGYAQRQGYRQVGQGEEESLLAVEELQEMSIPEEPSPKENKDAGTPASATNGAVDGDPGAESAPVPAVNPTPSTNTTTSPKVAYPASS